MKALKAKNLREKSVKDLETMLAKEELAFIELRRRAGLRDLKDVASVRQQRHNIARIITVLNEKRMGK